MVAAPHGLNRSQLGHPAFKTMLRQATAATDYDYELAAAFASSIHSATPSRVKRSTNAVLAGPESGKVAPATAGDSALLSGSSRSSPNLGTLLTMNHGGPFGSCCWYLTVSRKTETCVSIREATTMGSRFDRARDGVEQHFRCAHELFMPSRTCAAHKTPRHPCMADPQNARLLACDVQSAAYGSFAYFSMVLGQTEVLNEDI